LQLEVLTPSHSDHSDRSNSHDEPENLRFLHC
jgi:hypothetical protein